MDKSIKIDQCLYGYQDGHRLLSTSIKLPEESETSLLLLSDLAPNLNIPVHGSYWTGTPLPSLKIYALMRTWLAPEMSRPGCVWSHVILISFADIARFKDLSVLIKYLNRPNSELGFKSYSTSISIQNLDIEYNPYHSYTELDENLIHNIVQSLYSFNGVVSAPLGSADSAIFAIWSQQWPRLRRSFSFRTAANTNDTISNHNLFDLTIYQGDIANIKRVNNGSSLANSWESLCVKDLIYPGETDFRRFLWRYGSDIRQGRKRFKILANVYLLSRNSILRGRNLHLILAYITKNLISLEDGKVLKEDLISESQYSLLPKVDPIDMLDFFVSNPSVKKIPILTTRLFESLHDCWNERSDQILSIADKASKHETEFETQILYKLAHIVEPTTFIASTNSRPNLRYRLINLNPSLLADLDLSILSEEELLQYFDILSIHNTNELKQIIRKLVLIDSTKVAKDIARRFPDLTIITVLEVIDKALIKGDNPVPNAWTQVIATYTEALLRGGFIENSNSTSMLNFIASILGYGQKQVLEMGPIPWANGLLKASDNLKGNYRANFLAFLMELALHSPVRGSEPLFEISFEPLHTELLNSNLNRQLTANLLSYLPNLGWFNNWDICLRLRTAVVHHYINNNLSSASFNRLTNDKNLLEDMLKIANENKIDKNNSKKSPKK